MEPMDVVLLSVAIMTITNLPSVESKWKHGLGKGIGWKWLWGNMENMDSTDLNEYRDSLGSEGRGYGMDQDDDELSSELASSSVDRSEEISVGNIVNQGNRNTQLGNLDFNSDIEAPDHSGNGKGFRSPGSVETEIGFDTGSASQRGGGMSAIGSGTGNVESDVNRQGHWGRGSSQGQRVGYIINEQYEAEDAMGRGNSRKVGQGQGHRGQVAGDVTPQSGGKSGLLDGTVDTELTEVEDRPTPSSGGNTPPTTTEEYEAEDVATTVRPVLHTELSGTAAHEVGGVVPPTTAPKTTGTWESGIHEKRIHHSDTTSSQNIQKINKHIETMGPERPHVVRGGGKASTEWGAYLDSSNTSQGTDWADITEQVGSNQQWVRPITDQKASEGAGAEMLSKNVKQNPTSNLHVQNERQWTGSGSEEKQPRAMFDWLDTTPMRSSSNLVEAGRVNNVHKHKSKVGLALDTGKAVRQTRRGRFTTGKEVGWVDPPPIVVQGESKSTWGDSPSSAKDSLPKSGAVAWRDSPSSVKDSHQKSGTVGSTIHADISSKPPSVGVKHTQRVPHPVQQARRYVPKSKPQSGSPTSHKDSVPKYDLARLHPGDPSNLQHEKSSGRSYFRYVPKTSGEQRVFGDRFEGKTSKRVGSGRPLYSAGSVDKLLAEKQELVPIEKTMISGNYVDSGKSLIHSEGSNLKHAEGKKTHHEVTGTKMAGSDANVKHLRVNDWGNNIQRHAKQPAHGQYGEREKTGIHSGAAKSESGHKSNKKEVLLSGMREIETSTFSVISPKTSMLRKGSTIVRSTTLAKDSMQHGPTMDVRSVKPSATGTVEDIHVQNMRKLVERQHPSKIIKHFIDMPSDPWAVAAGGQGSNKIVTNIDNRLSTERANVNDRLRNIGSGSEHSSSSRGDHKQGTPHTDVVAKMSSTSVIGKHPNTVDLARARGSIVDGVDAEVLLNSNADLHGVIKDPKSTGSHYNIGRDKAFFIEEKPKVTRVNLSAVQKEKATDGKAKYLGAFINKFGIAEGQAVHPHSPLLKSRPKPLKINFNPQENKESHVAKSGKESQKLPNSINSNLGKKHISKINNKNNQHKKNKQSLHNSNMHSSSLNTHSPPVPSPVYSTLSPWSESNSNPWKQGSTAATPHSQRGKPAVAGASGTHGASGRASHPRASGFHSASGAGSHTNASGSQSGSSAGHKEKGRFSGASWKGGSGRASRGGARLFGRGRPGNPRWKVLARDEARELVLEKEGAWNAVNITSMGQKSTMCPLHRVTYQDNAAILDMGRTKCKVIITWHARRKSQKVEENTSRGVRTYYITRMHYVPVVTYMNSR